MTTQTPHQLSKIEEFVLTMLFDIWTAFGGRGRPIAILSMLAGFTSLYFGAFADTIWLRRLWTGAVVIYAVMCVSELVMMLVMTYILHVLDKKRMIARQWLRYCFVDFLNVKEMRARVHAMLVQGKREHELRVEQDKRRSINEQKVVQRFAQAYDRQMARLREEQLWPLIAPVLESRMQTFTAQAMSRVTESDNQFLAEVRAAVDRAAGFKGYFDRAVRLVVHTKFLELLHQGNDDGAVGVVLFAEAGMRLLAEAQSFGVPVVRASLDQTAYRAELASKIEAKRKYLERERRLDALRRRVQLVKEHAVRAHLETLLAAAGDQLDNERAFNKATHQLTRALEP